MYIIFSSNLNEISQIIFSVALIDIVQTTPYNKRSQQTSDRSLKSADLYFRRNANTNNIKRAVVSHSQTSQDFLWLNSRKNLDARGSFSRTIDGTVSACREYLALFFFLFFFFAYGHIFYPHFYIYLFVSEAFRKNTRPQHYRVEISSRQSHSRGRKSISNQICHVSAGGSHGKKKEKEVGFTRKFETNRILQNSPFGLWINSRRVRSVYFAIFYAAGTMYI